MQSSVKAQVMAFALFAVGLWGARVQGQEGWEMVESVDFQAEPLLSPVFQPQPLTEVQVGLPDTFSPSWDRLLVQPNVSVAPATQWTNPTAPDWLRFHRPSAEFTGDPSVPISQEILPAPGRFGFEPTPQLESQTPMVTEAATPVFDSILESAPLEPPMPLSRRFNRNGLGLGRERLAFALFDIDPAQPFNNFRIRSIVARRMRLPDRAEYFWGKAGGPTGLPFGESVVDYQEARLRMELGSKRFSTAFEVPFRATNPEINQNHAGLGDMQLIVKTVLLDGNQWLITQYFGTSFATGNATAGLGTGHVALEPGLLFRNEFRENTWMHGELKFLFPLGADPMHSGQVLKFGTGFNHVWLTTDRDAWIPSLEFTAFSVLNGMATDASQTIIPIDGDSIFYTTPGIRYAVDNKGDFGLFEVGSSVALAISRERFTDATWNFEMRWSW